MPGDVPIAEVAGAIRASNLGSIPDDVLEELLRGARRVVIEPSATIHEEGADDPHLELVLGGLVRVLVSAPDGRTMTIRYCRRGALIGVATLFGRPRSRAFAVQALVESVLLRLRPQQVLDVVARHPGTATALLRETSERVMAFTAELSGTAFASMRDRLARHLLDLASEQQHGRQLVVRVSQQELADAVGTVREVIVRELRALRTAGIVGTQRGEITILDPERLVPAFDQRGPAVDGWNTRS